MSATLANSSRAVIGRLAVDHVGGEELGLVVAVPAAGDAVVLRRDPHRCGPVDRLVVELDRRRLVGVAVDGEQRRLAVLQLDG
jgi:hypothetical protein